MAKVTLKQIAERAGVSINTVSLALRDMPNVNPDTRAGFAALRQSWGIMHIKAIAHRPKSWG